MKFFTYFFSALFLIFTGPFFIFGQDTSTVEQKEAPAAIWDMNLGDKDVDLYISGYWKIGILGGTTVESGPDGIIFPSAFPGLTDFKFYQEPDITISLWLMNRYYLETTFLEGFDKNTYAIGYRGQEGEILQGVRIGNSDISIDQYEGLDLPAPKYNTPGISANFESEISSHDVLIRYDPTSEQKKTFLGEYEVTEEQINPAAFKRGQFFILPDEQIDTGSLEVYIADPDGIYSSTDSKGTYRNFRKASENEYSFSLTKGTVSLNEPAESEVVVYYTKNGLAVGSFSLGNGKGFIAPLVNGEPDPGTTGSGDDFYWTATDKWVSDLPNFDESRSLTIDGNKALKIYTPFTLSPFELYNRYTIGSQLPQELWKTDIKLVDNSLTESEDSSTYRFSADPDKDLLTVLIDGNTDIRSPLNRYPFADNYPQIYSPETIESNKVGRTILLSIRKNMGLNLGPGVVPGSETISINGFETGAAEVNYDTGEILFNRYIYPSDRIEVTYRTETTDLDGGDLLVAQGNRFFPTENMELYLAEMFRWNLAKTAAASYSDSSPGGLAISGGLKYNSNNLDISLRATGGFSTPNTTGALRIAGMEETGYQFAAGSKLVKPSPVEIYDGTGALTANRSALSYTDFQSSDGLGQYFLNNYNWDSANVDSKKEGPSVATTLSGDPFEGNVMVFDFNMNNGEWSAGDLLLSSDGPIDLSHYDSISFYIKTDTITGYTAKIIIGENGEAEDYDSDGFAEKYDESYIVATPDLNLSGTNSDWKRYTYSFTSSEKLKLTRSRSVRLLLEATSNTSGRLMAGGLSFEGSIFDSAIYKNDGTEIPNSDSDYLYISEIGEVDANVSSLADKFPDVDQLFHSSEDEQKAVKFKWDLTTGTGVEWRAQTYTESIAPDSYSSFSFYIKNQSTGGKYDISLTDSQNKGYHFTYEPDSTEWQQLILSLEDGSVTNSDGTELATALIDSGIGELNQFSISSKDPDSGTLYLDELHYKDPSFSLDGTVELITNYTYHDVIAATPKGIPLLSDFAISNRFKYNGSTLLSEASNSSNALENITSLDITMLLIDLKTNMKINYSNGVTDISGSHSITFPSDFTYGYISDRYSRSGSGEDSSMTRENEITFRVPDKGNLTISAGSDGNGSVLVQNWELDTKWTLWENLNLNLNGLMEQNGGWDGQDRGNYFSNWIYDYALLAPLEEKVEVRSFIGSLSIDLPTEPVGFAFSPWISYSLKEYPETSQTNKCGGEISLPLSFISRND